MIRRSTARTIALYCVLAIMDLPFPVFAASAGEPSSWIGRIASAIQRLQSDIVEQVSPLEAEFGEQIITPIVASAKGDVEKESALYGRWLIQQLTVPEDASISTVLFVQTFFGTLSRQDQEDVLRGGPAAQSTAVLLRKQQLGRNPSCLVVAVIEVTTAENVKTAYLAERTFEYRESKWNQNASAVRQYSGSLAPVPNKS